MSLLYRLGYHLGVTPWEEMARLPISAQIGSFFEREEAEREAPYGRALDLGCGRGIWTARLAERGWDVTGIEIVPKAVRAARQRVAESGVEARVLQGDITRLAESDLGPPFSFVLDLGAIHGLRDPERVAVGHGLTAVTTPGSTLLLLAWVPARRGPLPRGMTRDDARAVLPGWDLVAEDTGDVSGAPGFVQRAKPSFYRFRRA